MTVNSINGKQGFVNLETSDIPESEGSLYLTSDERQNIIKLDIQVREVREHAFDRSVHVGSQLLHEVGLSTDHREDSSVHIDDRTLQKIKEHLKKLHGTGRRGPAGPPGMEGGSGSGGSITGTDTHVMFFDGDDNPAGDAGMTYNKSTNSIGVTGTGTFGTITDGIATLTGGDLTGLTSIQWDLTTVDTPAEGLMYWNDDDGTLNLGMPGGEVNLQIGQEMIVRVTNGLGVQIDNGTPVFISGASGSNVIVGKADADFATGVGFRTIAVATEDIAAGQKGFVTTQGMVRYFDTDSFSAEGVPLYLASGGGFTQTPPAAPDVTVLVAILTRKHASEGSIYVNITSIPNLNSLSDVQGSVANNDMLQWDAASNTWENKPLAADLVLINTLGSPTVDDLQGYIDNTGSSGFFTGGIITDTGGSTIDISAGAGFIRTTTDDNDPLLSFEFGPFSAVSIATDTTQYIYIDYNGGSPIQDVSTSEFLETPTKILIGVATNEAGVIESEFNLGVRLEESIGQAGRFIRRVLSIARDIRVGGLIVGETGTRNLTLSAGSLWWGRTEYEITALDTSVSGTFDLYYRDNPTGWIKSAVTQWPNEQYDNGSGTLVTMTNNRWSTLYVYIEADNHIVMVYGRAQYVSESQAEQDPVPSTLPPRLQNTAVLAGRLVFKKSAATAAITSSFTTVFQGLGVTDHVDLSNIGANSHVEIDTHITSDGSDHGFLDQSVVIGAAPQLLGTNITGVPAANVPIADAGVIITATEVEGALQENRTAINLNTAKVTNVTTDLSLGARTSTTMIVESSDGTDATLVEADTDDAGLLGADKWDEIVANSLKETNVPTALSTGTVNGTSYGITSDGGVDDIVIAQADTNNAGVLSAVKWDEIVANSLKSTNVPTALSVGTVGINTVAITSDGGADDVTLPAATVGSAGMLTTAKWAEIVANTAKVTNVSTNLSLGAITGTTMIVSSSDGTDATLLEANTDDAGLLGAGKFDEIIANSLKDTNANHSGEVTGSGALIIANNVVDEANLKLETGPTNDYVLTADSTKSGGMKWAEAGGSDAYTAVTAQTLTAPSTITAADGDEWTQVDSGSAITLTSEPHIAAGRNGQAIKIHNTGNYNITLKDVNALGGSLMRFESNSITIEPAGTLGLVYDSDVGFWVQTFLLNPQTFTPSVSSFTDDLSSTREVAAAATLDTAPNFTISYVGTPSVSSIDVSAGGDPAAQWPISVPSPYTALNGGTTPPTDDFYRQTSVGATRVFTVTATIAGQGGLTKDITLTYYNRRYCGPDNNGGQLSSAEILALDATAAGESGLSNSKYATFSNIDTTVGEYVYVAYRSSLGTLSYFSVENEVAAFTSQGVMSHTNDYGFVEDFQQYKSDNSNLGANKDIRTLSSLANNRIYIGPHSDSAIDNSGISELDDTADGESIVSSSLARTYTNIQIEAGEYLWFCHPDRISDLATIKDGTTGFGISGSYRSNVSHTNQWGYTETYRCWRSDNTGIYPTGENVVVT